MKAAAIAGIIFSVLLITSELLIWLSTPVYPSESASDVISHSKTTSLALNLLPFAAIAFLWFIAVVRVDALEDRFFATVFLGSGLLYLAMSFTSGAIAGGLIRALGKAPETVIQTRSYTLGRAEINEAMNIYGIKVAVVFRFLDLDGPAADRDRAALDCVPRLRLGNNVGTEHWNDRVDSLLCLGVGVSD